MNRHNRRENTLWDTVSVIVALALIVGLVLACGYTFVEHSLPAMGYK